MKSLPLPILLIIALLVLAPRNGYCAIAVDGISSAKTNGANSLTWPHTVASSAQGILIVGIAMNPVDVPVGTVTYNGAELTRIGTAQDSLNSRVEMWYLPAPPTGAHSVVVTLSGGNTVTSLVAGATSFTGVDQTAPFYGAFASNSGSTAPARVTVATSSVNQRVVDTLAVSGLLSIASPGAMQLELWNQFNSTLVYADGASSQAAGTGGNVVMTWDVGLLLHYWAIGAVVLNPAPPYQPDAMIRNSAEADDAYLTANFYETTAATQAKAQAVMNGTVATYLLKVVNNGASTDNIRLTGTAGGSGFTVEYRDGATDRTAAVTGSGAYTIIPSGGSMVWTVRVTPGAGVAGGSAYPVSVTAASVGDATKTDQVKATTSSTSPLLTLVKSTDKPSYKPGDDISYTVTATNGASLSSATSVSVTDPIPANTGFKVGGASFSAGTSTLAAAYSYSDNNGSTYLYTPASGSCSAPAGYDYCVTNVRWTMAGSMPTGTSFGLGLVVRIK